MMQNTIYEYSLLQLSTMATPLNRDVTTVYKKNFTLWNLNYLQAIVLIWQLWMLGINDPQKQARGLVHIEN